MKNWRIKILYLMLVAGQVILCNYFGLSQYVLISWLPVLILMLPHRMGSIVSMIVAFACGFVVDFFSTGMLGITSLALVPVALSRRALIPLVFGDEQVTRDEELSIARFGIIKMALAILVSCGIFFLVYIWADSAGTVNFWRAATRYLLSVLVSTPICLYVAKLLRPE